MVFLIKTIKFLILITVGLLHSNSLAERGSIDVNYQGKTIDNLIIEFIKENEIPGMSLAIVQAPYITRVVGYGLANLSTKQLVADNTLFSIGQMTNAYTAVAIMQLKEEGKIKLEDKLTNYIPFVNDNWSKITIFDLLMHRSGIFNYTQTENFDYTKDYTQNDILELIKSKPLEFESGSQTQYSSSNYYLLGIIIEKVSGVKYEDYITEKQLNPLELKNTYFLSKKLELKNEVKKAGIDFKHKEFKHFPVFISPTEIATGYSNNKELKNNSWGATFADSGIIASARDISLWDIGIAGDIFIKDENNRKILYEIVKTDKGKKFPSTSNWYFPGHAGLMHMKGDIPGYSSYLSRFTDPKELTCVTLLANKDNIPSLEILARKIAAAFDNKLSAPNGANWSETLQSPYSVGETIERLINILKNKNNKIFSMIDHKKEANSVNQELTDIEVISFGNPIKGTSLMQANPQIALDLPLRAMAWKDKNGEVWLTYTDAVKLAREYKIDDLEKAKFIREVIVKACQEAVGP